MTHVLTISGSPAEVSRSAAVLDYARNYLGELGLRGAAIAVRDLPAEDLIHADFSSAALTSARQLVAEARAIVIGTPVYKAAYSGVLKAFLDLLPPAAFADKLILPIATGGSPGHLLAIDYALKPVLHALGARHILGGVYIQEAQIIWNEEKRLVLDPDVEQRLQSHLQELARHLQH